MCHRPEGEDRCHKAHQIVDVGWCNGCRAVLAQWHVVCWWSVVWIHIALDADEGVDALDEVDEFDVVQYHPWKKAEVGAGQFMSWIVTLAHQLYSTSVGLNSTPARRLSDRKSLTACPLNASVASTEPNRDDVA